MRKFYIERGDIMDNITFWISVDESLPEEDEVVLVYRVGGKNKHDDVQLGCRVSPYGKSRDHIEWHTKDICYYGGWGISCDGSKITHWRKIPTKPCQCH